MPRIAFILLLLFGTVPTPATQLTRGHYFCSGGRDLSVSQLIEIHVIDDLYLDFILSAVRKPIYYRTTYRVIQNRLYIQFDRDTVFAFTVTDDAIVGDSYPYRGRRCAR